MTTWLHLYNDVIKNNWFPFFLKVIFTLKKKEFCHSDHQNTFVSKTGSWVIYFIHLLYAPILFYADSMLQN